MTKAQLIKDVATTACITQEAAATAVNRIRDAIVGGVRDNGRFELAGVGVFIVVERAARPGRNPQTGKTIEIPAKNAVKFKPSENLKREVNG